MRRRKERRVAESRRFRLDTHRQGDCVMGGEFYPRGDPEALARFFFPSADAAVQSWVTAGWDHEHPEPGVSEEWDPAKILLSETAIIVDRQLRRVVCVVGYRWPELGESRLPVAVVFDVPSGTLSAARVEDHERQQAA